METKILCVGCSFTRHWPDYLTVDHDKKAFCGKGLWYIHDELNNIDLKQYSQIICQLPTPVRYTSKDLFKTTRQSLQDIFNLFKGAIRDTVEANLLKEYKDEILKFNKLHDNIVYFIFNIGGYPFKHPLFLGQKIDEEMIDFFKKEGLNYVYLSFEGEVGYAANEREIDEEKDAELVERLEAEKGRGHLISPQGYLIIDLHPNRNASEIAANKIMGVINEKK